MDQHFFFSNGNPHQRATQLEDENLSLLRKAPGSADVFLLQAIQNDKDSKTSDNSKDACRILIGVA